MPRKPRRTFTQEFKEQIIRLYEVGKPRKEIISEYELTPSTFDKWVSQNKNHGSFKESDQLTSEQKELKALKKKYAQLEMENDILKQAALIFGRKSK